MPLKTETVPSFKTKYILTSSLFHINCLYGYNCIAGKLWLQIQTWAIDISYNDMGENIEYNKTRFTHIFNTYIIRLILNQDYGKQKMAPWESEACKASGLTDNVSLDKSWGINIQIVCLNIRHFH